MITPTEIRIGNYIQQKIHTRILPVTATAAHFHLIETGGGKDLYPVTLKADILEKAKFTENKDYPLLPDAREFILLVPVQASSNVQLRCYIKSNKECFGRAFVNDIPASNTVHQLHELQNLYYGLTGEELPVTL
ncbi:MAG: hypothetical protein ACM3VS_19110 [Candidatus Dadabacteria bacterium]